MKKNSTPSSARSMAFQSPRTATETENCTKARPQPGISLGPEMQKENPALGVKHPSLTKRLFGSENYDPNLTNLVMQQQGTIDIEQIAANRNVGVGGECSDEKSEFKCPSKAYKLEQFNPTPDAGSEFIVSPHKHVCKSRRCAANNPNYATPVTVQPRKFLVSKRHLLQPQERSVCKCCLERTAAGAAAKDHSARKREPCTCRATMQSKSVEGIDHNFGHEAYDNRAQSTICSKEKESGPGSNGGESRTSLILADYSLEEYANGNLPTVHLRSSKNDELCEGEERLQMSTELYLDKSTLAMHAYLSSETGQTLVSETVSDASMPKSEQHICFQSPRNQEELQLLSPPLCKVSTLAVSAYRLSETEETVAREMVFNEIRPQLEQHTDSQDGQGCGIQVSDKSFQDFVREESLVEPFLFADDSSGEMGEQVEGTDAAVQQQQNYENNVPAVLATNASSSDMGEDSQVANSNLPTVHLGSSESHELCEGEARLQMSSVLSLEKSSLAMRAYLSSETGENLVRKTVSDASMPQSEQHTCFQGPHIQEEVQLLSPPPCEVSTLAVSACLVSEKEETVASKMVFDEHRPQLEQHTNSQSSHGQGCGIQVSDKYLQDFAREESLVNPFLSAFDSLGEKGEVEGTDAAVQQQQNYEITVHAVLAKNASPSDTGEESQYSNNQQSSLSKSLNSATSSEKTNAVSQQQRSKKTSSETRTSEQPEGINVEQRTPDDTIGCPFYTEGIDENNKQERSEKTTAKANFSANTLPSDIRKQPEGANREQTSPENTVPCTRKEVSEGCQQTTDCIDIAAVEKAIKVSFHYQEKTLATEDALHIFQSMNNSKEVLSVSENCSFPGGRISNNLRKYHPRNGEEEILRSLQACSMPNVNHSFPSETRSCPQLDEERQSERKLKMQTGLLEVCKVTVNGDICIETGLGDLSFSNVMDDETSDLQTDGLLQETETSGNWRLKSIIKALQNLSPSQEGQVQLLIRAFERLMSSPNTDRLSCEPCTWKFPGCISQYPDSEENTYSKDYTSACLDKGFGTNCTDENTGQGRTVTLEALDLDYRGHAGPLDAVILECHGTKRKHVGEETETLEQFIVERTNGNGRQCPGASKDGLGIRWSFGDVEYETRFFDNQCFSKNKAENAQQRKFRGKVSKPQPFKLRTEQRGQIKEQQFIKKVEKMFTNEEKLRKHTAQCLPWTTDEPQILPKPPVKEQTKPVEFRLMTGIRAFERAEFDNYVAEKLSYLEQQRIGEERLRQIAEEEEIKRMRKEMIPHAQLMPYFDRPFIPKRSSKPLTVPKEPRFHYAKKKRTKCMEWDGIQVI